MYEAVKSSKIKFDGVDFNRLAVYLFLTIGVTGMYKCGLEHCIPVRRGGHSNANSLAPKYNREMDGWICKDYNYDENIKMEMLARMVQLETMTLMSSSCYSFGGRPLLATRWCWNWREGLGLYRENYNVNVGQAMGSESNAQWLDLSIVHKIC